LPGRDPSTKKLLSKKEDHHKLEEKKVKARRALFGA